MMNNTNVLRVSISPTKMVIAAVSEKRYKEDRMKEIISTICALLNSGDGKLEINFDETQNVCRQAVHDTFKSIEQKILEMIGAPRMTMCVTSEPFSDRIVFTVKQSNDLITVRYNFCLPSQTQVVLVPSNEPIENIKDVLQVACPKYKSRVVGSRRKTFTKGRNIGSLESSNVQYKNLKSEASKCVGLAARITCKSNKLSNYVSAFANHEGGHIYYGITDDGTVEGEEITENEKGKITRKVEKTIKKMIWPKGWDEVKRGIQWDIFFEKVVDSQGNPIPWTFVVIIYIAPCPGGVFMEEPESYYIAKGKVKRMSFTYWLTKLMETITPLRLRTDSAHLRDDGRKIRTF